MAELKQLKELLNAKMITQAEYDSKKKLVMDRWLSKGQPLPLIPRLLLVADQHLMPFSSLTKNLLFFSSAMVNKCDSAFIFSPAAQKPFISSD
jgi:hypothetical protein